MESKIVDKALNHSDYTNVFNFFKEKCLWVAVISAPICVCWYMYIKRASLPKLICLWQRVTQCWVTVRKVKFGYNWVISNYPNSRLLFKGQHVDIHEVLCLWWWQNGNRFHFRTLWNIDYHYQNVTWLAFIYMYSYQI